MFDEKKISQQSFRANFDKFDDLMNSNKFRKVTFIRDSNYFLESFNLWYPLLIITLYHQTKTPINFWCK